MSPDGRALVGTEGLHKLMIPGSDGLSHAARSIVLDEYDLGVDFDMIYMAIELRRLVSFEKGLGVFRRSFKARVCATFD